MDDELEPADKAQYISRQEGVELMATREEIIAEIQKTPDEHLAELYEIIKDFEARHGAEDTSDLSVMAKLRRIKISAPPDLSLKASLYDSEEKGAR
ncbi:MAG: hypothetical protein M3R15_27610 [Acidobacteriota bacterium]|nr:hypothetical protein [Acidobacteriota bacterium]